LRHADGGWFTIRHCALIADRRRRNRDRTGARSGMRRARQRFPRTPGMAYGWV